MVTKHILWWPRVAILATLGGFGHLLRNHFGGQEKKRYERLSKADAQGEKR